MFVKKLVEELVVGCVGGIFNFVICFENCLLQDGVMCLWLKILMFFVYDVIYGYCIIFFIGLGLVFSWDMDIVGCVMCIFVEEVVVDSIDMIFVFMVDISCDLCWGCMFEGFGEDFYLVLCIVEVLVCVLQGDIKFIVVNCVMVSVKYFVLYGVVEGGCDYNVVNMDLQCMYNDYLLLYCVVIDVGVGVVMVVFNFINGVLVIFNIWLLQDLLCCDWGFKGLIVFDYGVIIELVNYGVVQNDVEVVCLFMKVGIDMSMVDQVYIK